MPMTLGSSKLQKLDQIKKEICATLITFGNKNVTPRMLNEEFKKLVENDIPYKLFSFTSLQEFLISIPDVVSIKFDEKSKEIFLQPVKTERSKHIGALVACQRKPKFISRNEKFYCNIVKNNLTDPSLVLKVLQQFKNSLESNKIRKDKFLDLIKKQIGFYNFYNVDSLHNQIQELSHLLYYDDEYIYIKNEIQPIQTKATINKNSRELNKTNKIKSTSDLIRRKTKSRLAKLIRKHKRIWCAELPQIYCKEFGFDLEYISLGFNSILEFVSALRDIFTIITDPETGRTFVAEAIKSELNVEKGDASIDKNGLQSPEIFYEPVSLKLADETLKVLIPKYVSSFFNIDITRVSRLNVNNSEPIDVIVSDVRNPSSFWVTLYCNKKIIKEMMKKLHTFYDDQDMTKYIIPKLAVKPGLHVACKFDCMWHRGVIIKAQSEDLSVYFYDYGTLKKYKRHEVYFLDMSFSAVPAQAIPCSLYSVKPIASNKWPRESSKRFMELVLNKRFTANILKRNDEENSLEIDLYCKKTSEGVHTLLLQESLAEQSLLIDNM